MEITINEDSVELNCVNRNDPRPMAQRIGGLGNELIQKRLNLIYTGKHTLDIQNNKEQYQVYLNIHHG